MEQNTILAAIGIAAIVIAIPLYLLLSIAMKVVRYFNETESSYLEKEDNKKEWSYVLDKEGEMVIKEVNTGKQ